MGCVGDGMWGVPYFVKTTKFARQPFIRDLTNVGASCVGDTCMMKDYMMATGTVKWFNPTKGFGFIVPDEGGADAFVHISAVERAGLTTLNEGQRVNFDLEDGRNGKKSAENISAAD